MHGVRLGVWRLGCFAGCEVSVGHGCVRGRVWGAELCGVTLVLTRASIKMFPQDYVKIIVSFYQVSTAFSSNVDVKWPDAVTSVWKFFAFLTMEIFKLYGYDCMFGGIDYLGRLLLVTTVPLIVVLIFILPWIASFHYQSHRRSRVFDTCANSVMWITYLIYPLLCLMTIQGFKCIDMEGMHLLAADLNEPCPWKKGERGSGIFVWSVISMALYPIGIPLILLACLLRLNVPRLARYGKGEAIFQQLISLYIKERDEGVCSRIANYVGGHKDINQPQAGLPERAAHFFREVSSNGEHAVTCERFLTWLTFDVTDDDRDEMSQVSLGNASTPCRIIFLLLSKSVSIILSFSVASVSADLCSLRR